MITYLSCFNSIKLALIQKKQYTYININNKNNIILNLFIKYNIITGYKIISIKNSQKYLVFLNKSVAYFNIKNLLKITKPRHIKFKELIKLNNKNTHTTYILCTSKGFLNIKEAIFQKIGGILIFRIC